MFEQEREDAMARGKITKDKAKCPECRVSLPFSNKVNNRVRWTRDVWCHLNLSRQHISPTSKRRPSSDREHICLCEVGRQRIRMFLAHCPPLYPQRPVIRGGGVPRPTESKVCMLVNVSRCPRSPNVLVRASSSLSCRAAASSIRPSRKY